MPIVDSNAAYQKMRDNLHAAFDGQQSQMIEPTGVQEDYIIPIGNGKFSIYLILDNNKAGKTSGAVNVLKNIFWEPDPMWFNYPVFHSWPFDSKAGRITGTTKNTADNGPIRKEIEKWWPKARYHSQKSGKPYHSEYSTDTGFEFDVLTYHQDADDYEGPMLSWTWSDEPPRADLVGAITSRFAGGGMWIITATPVRCGPFIDIIGDLRDRGKKVFTITHQIYESDKDTGKPNHRNTKRGLWTKAQIDDYVAGIPIDEVEARVYGKANAKSGKVYPAFDRNAHVKDVNLTDPYYRASNCFCVMDPHKKGFPAVQWWMLTPDEDFICYNEWPTRATLRAYYDEVRDGVTCNYNPEEISQFLRILDGTQYGLKIRNRWMDPRFGKSTEGEYGRKTESLMLEYARWIQPEFELPSAESIDIQRERIRALLKWDRTLPPGANNHPHMYVMPHCENTIRALERHFWAEPKTGAKVTEVEAPRYKDFVDTIRYMLAGLGDEGYISPSKKVSPEMRMEPVVDSIMHDVALG